MAITKIPLAGLADDVQEKLNVTNSVTGTQSAAQFKSNRTVEDARNTGFQYATGADIGEGNRSTQYYDDRATNCNGYLGNGNCQGDPYWTPPNGDWWTWGSGFPTGNCFNNGSYDGAGGYSSTLYAVSVNFNYDGYYEAANEIGGSEQRRWYRNCNCGNYGNCRTNCNCNCNCACDCGNG